MDFELGRYCFNRANFCNYFRRTINVVHIFIGLEVYDYCIQCQERIDYTLLSSQITVLLEYQITHSEKTIRGKVRYQIPTQQQTRDFCHAKLSKLLLNQPQTWNIVSSNTIHRKYTCALLDFFDKCLVSIHTFSNILFHLSSCSNFVFSFLPTK